MWPEYNELLRSDVADMKNSAGREAGTIAGAMFLAPVRRRLPVGATSTSPAWRGTTATSRTGRKGSVGVGVRLLVDFVERTAAKK